MFVRTIALLAATIAFCAFSSGCTLWPPIDERAVAKPSEGGCELTVQTRIWGLTILAGRYPITGRFYVPSAHGKFQASQIHAMYGDVTPYSKPYKVSHKSGTISIDDRDVIIDLTAVNGEPDLFNGTYPLANSARCK